MSMVSLGGLASIPYRTFPSFKIGPVTVRTFGVFVAIGIVVGVWCLLRFARDHELDAERLSRLAVWVVVLGIVGSRLLFVVTRWSEFRHDLPSVLAVWQGGLQFSGAFLVAIVAIWWFSRRHPEFGGLRLSDGIVLGLAPGLAMGASDAWRWESTSARGPRSSWDGSTWAARRASRWPAGSAR